MGSEFGCKLIRILGRDWINFGLGVRLGSEKIREFFFWMFFGIEIGGCRIGEFVYCLDWGISCVRL